MMPDDEEEEDACNKSGPFCLHYGDPLDCDKICGSCGHPCKNHDVDGICMHGLVGETCECEKWKEAGGGK
jgi:hypothetical protein